MQKRRLAALPWRFSERRSSPTVLALGAVFLFRFFARLPLHVPRCIFTAASERPDVIDHVTRTGPVGCPVAGHGCSRLNSRLAAVERWIRCGSAASASNGNSSSNRASFRSILLECGDSPALSLPIHGRRFFKGHASETNVAFSSRSILTGQVDDVVGEIELDGVAAIEEGTPIVVADMGAGAGENRCTGSLC